MKKTELERYNRQIMLPGIGESGQKRISKASILVVGAGGLGCPVIQYLTGAGVGKIGIIDADKISLSNLQRQILYTENEIGEYKASIAASKMHKLNSEVKFEVYTQFLNNQNAEPIIDKYDVIVGATDNLESRYLIDKLCYKLNTPFVHGAVSDFEGQYSVFNYNNSPSYSDVFPAPPPNNNKTIGVIGAFPGVIGSYMALETLKIITKVGKISSDGLYIINGLNNSMLKLSY